MAFPGTYNINYYKGDTFEFRIYPKDSTGAKFDITSYTQFRFTISNILGDTAPAGETKTTLLGYAENIDDNYILCAIKPENGSEMIAGVPYYYDVEIGRIDSPYDKIYTVLQGTINVSEQVTLPASIPNSPQNVAIVFSSSTEATVTWTAPTGTSPISYYNVYLVTPSGLVPLNTSPLSSSTTYFYMQIPPEYVAFFPPGTPVVIGVAAENISGESVPGTVSSVIPSPTPS